MPELNLGEIMSIATTDCGRDAGIPVSVVSQRANIAYFEVADAGDFALRERDAWTSLTSGENRIDLPSDCADPISMSLVWSTSTSSSNISSTKTLHRVSTSYIDANGYLPLGTPDGYAYFRTWIELTPSPDSGPVLSGYSLKFRYRSQVTDMTSLSAVPSIATPARYAIVLKLEELLWRYKGNYAAAQAAEQAYVNYMLRLKSDQYRRQMDESPMGLQPVYGNSRTRRTTGAFDKESGF